MTGKEKAQAVELALVGTWEKHHAACSLCGRPDMVFCPLGIHLVQRDRPEAWGISGRSYEVHYSDGTIEHRVS